MIVSNVSAIELTKAFSKVNRQYKNNLRLQSEVVNAKGTRHKLRLFVKDSSKPGARRGHTGRRMINACWHVHGHYFDALLAIQPAAEIRAAGGVYINKDGGNWTDRNIGSIVQPLFFSEACEC